MLKRLTVLVSLSVLLAVFAVSAPPARAESGFFTSQCASCHPGVSSTCAGCHAHGVHSSNAKSDINVAGKTGKTAYAPGETVSVTISGGYRSGWARAILYDQNMKELARSTGSSGMGGGPGLPVTLSAPAPATPGTYNWNVAWYGNRYDMAQVGGTTKFGARWTPDPNNPNHGQEIVATNAFTVTGTAAPDINLSPALLGFGTVTVGGSSTQVSQVQNIGNADLNVTALAPCAGTSGEYRWSPAAPFTVAAGGSQTLSVTYTPVDAGSDSGCLQVASNDPTTASVTLNLSGAGSEPPVQVLDLDIAGFSATRRVSLSRPKPVQLKLTVANPGTFSGSADATLVGTAGGAQVYSQSLVVSAPAGGTVSYAFPTYLPAGEGNIAWTLTIADQDPDVDQATATTKVVK